VVILAVGIGLDEFTPCLIEASTNKVVDTIYSIAKRNELVTLKNWLFDWLSPELRQSTIYKLTTPHDNTIQGLVAIVDYRTDRATFVELAESAPHNKGCQKQYIGVGGHLFAIAAQISVERGYGGFLFLDAKNMELVEHYRSTLGAVLLGRPYAYRMIIDEEAAHNLLSKYTLSKEG